VKSKNDDARSLLLLCIGMSVCGETFPGKFDGWGIVFYAAQLYISDPIWKTERAGETTYS